jgi:large subunit ribosomal protein L18
MKESIIRRIARHKKIRASVVGTKETPRLFVRRTNSHIYGSLIDDKAGKTLIEVSDKSLSKKKVTKTEKAKEVGKSLAEKAVKEKIKKVVFDRGGYLYHGRVKALAEGAREGGLNF